MLQNQTQNNQAIQPEKSTGDPKKDAPSPVENLLKLQIEAGDIEKNVKTYYLPLIAFLAFLGILFFLSIPKIQSYTGQIEEKKKLEGTYTKLASELKELEQLRVDREANADMHAKLNTIIPTKLTEVVGFQGKVSELASNAFITVGDSNFGEKLLLNSKGQTEEATVEMKLVQMPVDFELSGTVDNFRNLLFSIYNSDDFIVVTEMSLSNPDEGDAEIKMTLSKYQFAPLASKEAEEKILSTVSYKEKPDQNVIEFIKRKSNATTTEQQ